MGSAGKVLGGGEALLKRPRSNVALKALTPFNKENIHHCLRNWSFGAFWIAS
jgi:hypothetical protein